jgi:hypothetical protein
MAKYGKSASKNVKSTMSRRKKGTLKSGRNLLRDLYISVRDLSAKVVARQLEAPDCIKSRMSSSRVSSHTIRPLHRPLFKRIVADASRCLSAGGLSGGRT